VSTHVDRVFGIPVLAHFYIDHCQLSTILYALVGGGLVVTVAAVICAANPVACAAAFIAGGGVLAALIAAFIGWMSVADGKCNNLGVYLDVTILPVPGLPFVQPLC
jgi:hypothetical protein